MLQDAPTSPATGDGDAQQSMRRAVFRVLETAEDKDFVSRTVDIGLIALIAGSVVAVVLESIPAVERAYATELYWFEVVTVAVFSVEYLLRVWSSVEASADPDQVGFRYRLKFMTSPHAVIDLVAILPFFLLTLGLLGNVDMRFLRAVRLFRVLKLTRYFAAMNLLIVAIRENARALGAAFMILITIMLFAASGMYYFERVSQPEDFGSIPAAMWWAFATLTTVGYGDVTPITVGGKIFGALITVVGIGMVALPTSILASGYSQQLKINAQRYRDETDRALDDGVIDEDEYEDLEELRMDLGLSRHTASQIIDSELAKAALRHQPASPRCPNCQHRLTT